MSSVWLLLVLRCLSVHSTVGKCRLCGCCLSVAVPHSNLYIVVSPVCAVVDYLTIEWLNEFLLDLAKRAVSVTLNSHPYSPELVMLNEVRIRTSKKVFEFVSWLFEILLPNTGWSKFHKISSTPALNSGHWRAINWSKCQTWHCEVTYGWGRCLPVLVLAYIYDYTWFDSLCWLDSNRITYQINSDWLFPALIIWYLCVCVLDRWMDRVGQNYSLSSTSTAWSQEL